LQPSLNLFGRSFATPIRVGTISDGKHSWPADTSADAKPILVEYVPISITNGRSYDYKLSFFGLLSVISSPSFSSCNFASPFGLTACLII